MPAVVGVRTVQPPVRPSRFPGGEFSSIPWHAGRSLDHLAGASVDGKSGSGMAIRRLSGYASRAAESASEPPSTACQGHRHTGTAGAPRRPSSPTMAVGTTRLPPVAWPPSPKRAAPLRLPAASRRPTVTSSSNWRGKFDRRMAKLDRRMRVPPRPDDRRPSAAARSVSVGRPLETSSTVGGHDRSAFARWQSRCRPSWPWAGRRCVSAAVGCSRQGCRAMAAAEPRALEGRRRPTPAAARPACGRRPRSIVIPRSASAASGNPAAVARRPVRT